MLTCYIIDDEKHAIKSLSAYVDKVPSLQLIGTGEDPLTALAYLQNRHSYPDIIFLDIDMPTLSGIEVSKLLSGKTQIVFTTAHPHFAADAFDLEVVDYLLKPISFPRFLKCLDRIKTKIPPGSSKEEGNPYFYIQTESKGKLIKIKFEDILCIESQKNYVSLTTKQGKYLTYLTLSEIEQQLPSHFMRINKSAIINLEKIVHIEGPDIYIDSYKESFLIGSTYKQEFSAYMKDHIIKSKRNQS